MTTARRCGATKPAPRRRRSSSASSMRACRAPEIRAGDYADFYRSLIVGENVRPRVAVHPRLFIWGPFEARLQQTDVMVLGSLNDGTWPEAADPGPWLNRPMRAALGLPSPEERIGHAAHDFTSFLAAPNVFSHARAEDRRRADRAVALAHAAAGAAVRPRSGRCAAPDKPWLGWARARDAVTNRIRIEAPEPRPPVDAAPAQDERDDDRDLARQPLRHFRKPHAEARQAAVARRRTRCGAARLDRARHHAAVCGEVSRRAAGRHASRAARDRGRGARPTTISIPRVAAFWLPRFERFAAWFAETEPARRRAWCASSPRSADSLIVAGSGRAVHADRTRRPHR